MKKKLLLGFILLFSFLTQAQDLEHWLSPVPLVRSGTQADNSEMYFINDTAFPAIVEVFVGTSTTSTIVNVGANSFTRVPVPSSSANGPMSLGPNNTQLGTVLSNKGYYIKSNVPIAVDYRYNIGNTFADIAVSKGTNGLGTAFRIGSYVDAYDTYNRNDFASFYATEDGTEVKITNLEPGRVYIGLNGGAAVTGRTQEFTVNLSKGQTFAVVSSQTATVPVKSYGSMNGALITSNNPITVMNGMLNITDIGNGSGNHDISLDQNIPITAIGTDYVISATDYGNYNTAEGIMIVAHSNNTSVFLNGAAVPDVTLKAGEWKFYDGSIFTTDQNMYVRTSVPAYAFQTSSISGVTSGPEQGGWVVPPFSCSAPKKAYIPQVNKITGLTAPVVNLLITTRAEGLLKINGTDLATLLAAGTVTNYGTNEVNGHYIQGSGDYVTYKLSGSAVSSGNVRIECTADLYCALNGALGGSTSYGGFYSGFKPVINLYLDPTKCLPQTLDITDPAFNSYRWYRNNVLISGEETGKYTIVQDGEYYVEGIINDCITVTSNIVTAVGVPSPTTTQPTLNFCKEDKPTFADLQATLNALTQSQTDKFSTYVWYSRQVLPTDTFPETQAEIDANRFKATDYVDPTFQGVNATYYVGLLEHATSTTGAEKCQSAIRLAISVIFDPIPPAPILEVGGNNQVFCSLPAPTVTDLVATPEPGYTVAWYDSQVGGARLSSVTALLDGTTYYGENYSSINVPCSTTNRAAVTVDLQGPVTIVKNIVGKKGCVGGDATFNFQVATGKGGTPVYTWEQSTDGTNWTAAAGATDSPSYTKTNILASENGLYIRVTAKITECTNPVVSQARLTIEGPITFVKEPQDITGCENTGVTFEAEATAGVGLATYVWEESFNGGVDWAVVGSGKTYTKSPLSASQSGNLYRVGVKSETCVTKYSREARLTVEGPFALIRPVEDITVCNGGSTIFSIEAEVNNATPKYQWFEGTKDATDPTIITWAPMAGQDTSYLDLPSVTAADNQRLFKVEVTSTTCTTPLISEGTLNVEGPVSITAQPSGAEGCAGGTAEFTVGAFSGADPSNPATAQGELIYTWLEKVAANKPYTVIATGKTLIKSPLNLGQNGYLYKVRVSTAACPTFVESDAVALVVEGPLSFSESPQDFNTCVGGDFNFTGIGSAGSGTPIYQWSKRSAADTAANGPFVDLVDGVDGVAGATTANLSVTGGTLSTISHQRDEYRVKISSRLCTEPVYAYAKVIIEGPIENTVAPVNKQGCAGETIVFQTSATTGEGKIIYDWEESSDNGGTWLKVSTVQNYSKVLTAADNGKLVRVGYTTDVCRTTFYDGTTASIVVEGPILVAKQAANTTVCEGGTATFDPVATTNNGTLTYQWQVGDTQTGPWTDLAGETNATLTLTNVNAANQNKKFYSIVYKTGLCQSGDVRSTAQLTVEGPITITTQPTSQTGCHGGSVTFTVETNTPTSGTLSYIWEESINGGPWLGVASTKNYVKTSLNATQSGTKIRVKIKTATCADVISDETSILFVEGPVTFSKQLQDVKVCQGTTSTATFTAVSETRLGTMTYAWEERAAGATTWTVIPGETSNTYTKTGITYADDHDKEIRIAVTTAQCTNPYYSTAKISVEGPVIVSSQPDSDIYTCDNTSIQMAADGGTPNYDKIYYLWEESSDGGVTWSGVATTAVYNKSPIKASHNGYKFRLGLTTEGCTTPTYSDIVNLHVEGPITISSQLKDYRACAAESAEFVVSATVANATPIYTWEQSSDNGASWTAAPSADNTKNTYSYPNIQGSDNGKKIRVGVSSTSCTKPKYSTATIYVDGPITINTQPVAAVTVCHDGTITLTVGASTQNGTLTYLWEELPFGTTEWLPLGNNKTLVKTPIKATQNGNKYRVQVGGGNCTPIISNETTLTVEGPLEITTDVKNTTTCVGEDAVFTVEVNAPNATPIYKWYSGVQDTTNPNNIIWTEIANSNAATYTVANTSAANNNTYYSVRVSSAQCTRPIESHDALLKVEGPISITAHPQDVDSCANGTATFNVDATTSSGDLSYEWLESTDGGTSWNVVGVGKTLVRSPLNAIQNNYQYKVSVTTSACAPVETNVATLRVYGPITIIEEIQNVNLCEGNDAEFKVNASLQSSGTLAYEWQERAKGATDWTTIAGQTTNTYIKPASEVIPAASNTEIRVLVSTANCATPQISTAKLYVEGMVTINTVPQSVTACAGDIATFTVDASTLSGKLTYQWEESPDGTTWNPVGSNAKTFVKSPVNASIDGYQYRVNIKTDLCPVVTTTPAATITVEGPLNFDANLYNQTVCAGEDVTFEINVNNSTTNGTVTYKWLVSDDLGDTWTTIAGETTNKLILTAVTPDLSGNLYRVSVSTANCTSVTKETTARLFVDGPVSIVKQPTSQTVCAGENAFFSVETDPNAVNVSYTWQESSDAGASWKTVGALPTLNVSGFKAYNGYQYKAIVSAGKCIKEESNIVTLTVEGPIIYTKPLETTSVCANTDVTFNVIVDASGATVSYSWEYSTDLGYTWTSIAGATSDSYTVTGVTSALNERQYRVSAKTPGCANAATSIGILKVEGPVQIIEQPKTQTVCSGDIALFNVVMLDTPTTKLNYIWEKSTDGTNWSVVSRAGSFSVITTLANNGDMYRARVSSTHCAEVISEVATLTVEERSEFRLEPESVKLNQSEDATFTVEMADNTRTYQYQWQVDKGSGLWENITDGTEYTGTNTNTLTVLAVQQIQNGYLFRVSVPSCSGLIYSDDAELMINNEILPNMFSPNGDGINDEFVIPYLRNYPEFSMDIYDRWGNLVHHIQDDGDKATEPDWWKGYSTGNLNYQDGQILPTGSYYYIIHYNPEDSKAPKTGWVYLRK